MYKCDFNPLERWEPQIKSENFPETSYYDLHTSCGRSICVVFKVTVGLFSKHYVVCF